MRAFSNSLVNVMTPVISTALLALSNIQTIIAFDLFTFVIAFLSLLFFVKIPKVISTENAKAESVLESAKSRNTVSETQPWNFRPHTIFGCNKFYRFSF